MIDQIILKLNQREDLTFDEVRTAFLEILDGFAQENEIADFLLALKAKGETATEIAEAVRVVREKAVSLKTGFLHLVDNCGTGGDQSSTFNISTAAALVAAAAGAKIAKHGNRAFSSQAGSADVLEALGIRVDISPAKTIQCIEQTNFGFLFAPYYHPALKRVGEIRKRLKTKTIFNLIGPLANPAFVKRQLIGVADAKHLSVFAEVLKDLQTEQAMIVHGQDGLDEISLTGLTDIDELKNGNITSSTFDPQKFGFIYCQKSDLLGGDAKVNAKIIESILMGEKSPRRDVVVLNASAILCLSGVAENIEEGIRKAQEGIDSGNATKVLTDLKNITA